MNILITGGLGYIGSHTCVELLNQNHKIIIIDNLSNTTEDILLNISKITNVHNIFLYKINITNERELDKIFAKHNITLVIHFAGLKSVNESLADPLIYYHNNVGGTISLLKIMKKYNCKRIIFSSSATVYGLNNYPVDESAHIGNGITNVYGKTKLIIENILNDMYNSDYIWSIIILRYFNPIGSHNSGLLKENPKGIPNNLFPYLTKVYSKELNCLNIFGNNYETPDGTCIRDFIHVVDIAKGHVAAIKKIFTPGVHIYNLGTGKGTSVLELIETFEKVNNTKINYKFENKRIGDLPIVYANVNKAKCELDWIASLTLDDMCKYNLLIQ